MSISFDFTGKSVLVTGASSGIGRGVASAFAKAGADLTILSSTDSIHEAAATMRGNVKAIKCDISDASAVTAALAGIERVDVLVNNAGRSIRRSLDRSSTSNPLCRSRWAA